MNIDTLRTVQLLRRSINYTPGSAHLAMSSLSVAAESEVGSNTTINSHKMHYDPKKSCQKSCTASFEENMAM